MRIEFGLAAVLAVAAAGCQSGAFDDDAGFDARKHQTPAGWAFEVPVEGGRTSRVVVEKVENRLDGVPAATTLTLKNTGSPIEVCTFEVEFGFPAHEDSFAPYVPHFETEAVADWKSGESKVFQVRVSQPPREATGTPLFTRVVPMTGAAIRATTARESGQGGVLGGTTLLSGRVEVVQMDADFLSAAPRLSFTLENVDPQGGDRAIGDLSYTVQFFKGERLLDPGQRRFRGFRGIGKPLGKRGDRVNFEVEGLAGLSEEFRAQLGGAKPVLTVKL